MPVLVPVAPMRFAARLCSCRMCGCVAGMVGPALMPPRVPVFFRRVGLEQMMTFLSPLCRNFKPHEGPCAHAHASMSRAVRSTHKNGSDPYFTCMHACVPQAAGAALAGRARTQKIHITHPPPANQRAERSSRSSRTGWYTRQYMKRVRVTGSTPLPREAVRPTAAVRPPSQAVQLPDQAVRLCTLPLGHPSSHFLPSSRPLGPPRMAGQG